MPSTKLVDKTVKLSFIRMMAQANLRHSLNYLIVVYKGVPCASVHFAVCVCLLGNKILFASFSLNTAKNGLCRVTVQIKKKYREDKLLIFCNLCSNTPITQTPITSIISLGNF